MEAGEKLRTPGGGALGGVRGVDGERGGSAVVTAKVAQQESSRTRLLHLVNFKFEQPLKDVAVRIRIPEGMRVREVVKTPDEAAGRRVEFSVTSANVSLRVSRPGAYALALVRMAAK